MFQAIDDIKKYTNVIQFMCGMSKDTQCIKIFLSLACDKFITQINTLLNSRNKTYQMQSHLTSWCNFLVNVQREIFSTTDQEVFSWCEAFSVVDTDCLQGNYTSYDLSWVTSRRTIMNTIKSPSFQKFEQFINK